MAGNDGIIVGIGGDLTGLQQSLSRAMSHVAKFAAGLTGLVSIGSTLAGLKSSLDLGKELTETANRTGIAVGSLYDLRKAFKDAGVDAGEIGPAINKMQKSIGDGKNGSLLASLGLDQQSLASARPEEAFHKIGDAIAALPNSTERAQAAMQLFGKSGGQLLQIFSDPNFKSGGGISNTAKILEENAGIFDKASDSIGHISGKMTGLFAGVESNSAALLNTVADSIDGIDLTGLGQSLGNIVGNFSTNFMDEFEKVGTFIADLLALVFSKDGIIAFGEGLVIAASKMGDGLLKAFKTPLDYIEAGLQHAIELVMEQIGRIPGLGKSLGLSGFKASSMDDTLKEVQARGNGIQNNFEGNSETRSLLGADFQARMKRLKDKASESLAPVITATGETIAANNKARQENATRVMPNSAYDPTEIGKGLGLSGADSLTKIGGGGNSTGQSNPLLDINRQQLAEQKSTNRLLSRISKPGGNEASFTN
jgi:hypothetical protein